MYLAEPDHPQRMVSSDELLGAWLDVDELTLHRSTLSKQDRKAYTAAVNCLATKPARTPASYSTGAKTRWDVSVSLP